MANVDVDILLHIYRIETELDLGHSSTFTSTPHPGTNKTIDGWKWDERTWPSNNELEANMYAPNIWDPNLSGIDSDTFQTGYGDNTDLALLYLTESMISGYNKWSPAINHGYYYVNDDEYYLFCDQYRAESVKLTNVVSGIQYHALSKEPKQTIPIKVRGYEFDFSEGKYIVDIDVRKKVVFSGSMEPEFISDTSINPPQLVFNQVINTAVGNTVSGVSGNTDPSDIAGLEFLGLSTGQENQEFYTQYSPIDPSQPIEVWTWFDTNAGYPYTLISGIDKFSSGDNPEVYIDYERGVIRFGDYSSITGTGSGRIPTAAMRIGIHYTRGLEVAYEPINTQNDIIPYYQDIELNPIRTGTQYGFIQTTTSLPDPDSIELSSTLVKVNPYIISLGNYIGELQAIVYSSNGSTVDGQVVNFEILSPILGTFGGSNTTTSSISANGGVAKTLYHAPLTAADVGGIANIDDVTVSGSQTTISFNGLANLDSISGIYLYKLHKYDEALGIEDLSSYYTDYTEEQEFSGIWSTQSYEQEFRNHWNLLEPTVYSSLSDGIGKKTLLMTRQPNGTMDTHSGIESNVYTPLFPISYSTTTEGTANLLHVTYNTALEAPGTGDTKAYFGVANGLTKVRAYLTHPRTGIKIYSNTIELRVTLPDTINGTFFADALSEIPDKLLTRVGNVNNMSDASILTTSGNQYLWDEYLQDRQLDPPFALYGNYILKTVYPNIIDVPANTGSTLFIGISFVTNSSGNYITTQPTVGTWGHIPWILNHYDGYGAHPDYAASLNYAMKLISNHGAGWEQYQATWYAPTSPTASLLGPPLSATLMLQSSSAITITKHYIDSNPSPFNITTVTGRSYIALIGTLSNTAGSTRITTSVALGGGGTDPAGSTFTKLVEGEIIRADDDRYHMSIWYLPEYTSSGAWYLWPTFSGAGAWIGGLIEVTGNPEVMDLTGIESYVDWFRRTRVGDTVGLTRLAEEFDDPTLSGLNYVTPQAPTTNITIPLGFRLKSTGLRAASILDQITYLDPNEYIASGLFHVDY